MAERSLRTLTPAAGAFVWARSSLARAGELDLHVSATHYIDPATSPTGGALVLASALTLPDSQGTVRLASRDPRAAPRIRYNFFTDPGDLARLGEATELARKIAATAPLAEMIDHEIVPGPVDGDDALRGYIKSTVVTYAHPTATVPMGTNSDNRAVVDACGKVRNTAGLRVVDASIVPDAVSVATNPTIIMLAERIAARIVA
jgi:choline dehydrogenase